MKLYICLTTYHMLAACALAIKDEENSAEILIEAFCDEENDVVKSIRKSNIFREVHFINQSEAWVEVNKLDDNSSGMQIFDAAKSTVRFWSEHFKYFKYITKRYSEINIWDDHFTLGVALAYLKIPYNYYEESPGCHYRRDVFIKLSKDRIANKAFAPLAEQFGVRGANPYVKSCNYDFMLNPISRDGNDKDFCLIRELKIIKESMANKFNLLKEIFAKDGYFQNNVEDNYDKEKKNFILIGQHYSDLTYKNVAVIKYALSLLVDYFGENMNLWIKNHPSNYFNPIKSWFRKATFIEDKVPIELLVADNVIEIERVVSISSSAPLAMKSTETEVILFQNNEDSDSFETQRRFLDMHRYYVIIKLIEKICLEKQVDILYTYGIEPLTLQYLSKYQTKKIPEIKVVSSIMDLKDIYKDTNGIKCYFFDRIQECDNGVECNKKVIAEWLLQCDSNDVIFFANSDNKDIFFYTENYCVEENLFPLPIDLTDMNGESNLFGYGSPEFPLINTIGKLHQESYKNCSNSERQIVYMYTKNEEVTRMLLSCHIEKKLQHCGIELVYNPLEINYKELVFESMLEQLEKQYVDLQAENMKLKKQMTEIMEKNTLCEESIINQMSSDKEIIDAINSSSTMLMNRMTEIDGRVIHLLSWYGLKKRVKAKFKSIFKSKRKGEDEC